MLGMNLCGLFNLSVSYGYTSNVSRTVLERLGVPAEAAKAPLPGLQLLSAVCVGGEFMSICQVFKWSFYLHKIINNALYLYTLSWSITVTFSAQKLSVQLQICLE